MGIGFDYGFASKLFSERFGGILAEGAFMTTTANRALYWTPRILCLAFAVFLSLFALDVFQLKLTVAEKAFALVMHLIPALTVLAVLAIVWRREWIGAILFPLLAVAHFVSMRGRLDWSGYAAIEAPLVLLGVLFWLSWKCRGR